MWIFWPGLEGGFQEALTAPFLKKGLFSRGKTDHEGIRGDSPLRSENGPFEGKRPIREGKWAVFGHPALVENL